MRAGRGCLLPRAHWRSSLSVARLAQRGSAARGAAAAQAAGPPSPARRAPTCGSGVSRRRGRAGWAAGRGRLHTGCRGRCHVAASVEPHKKAPVGCQRRAALRSAACLGGGRGQAAAGFGAGTVRARLAALVERTVARNLRRRRHEGACAPVHQAGSAPPCATAAALATHRTEAAGALNEKDGLQKRGCWGVRRVQNISCMRGPPASRGLCTLRRGVAPGGGDMGGGVSSAGGAMPAPSGHEKGYFKCRVQTGLAQARRGTGGRA